MGYTLNSAKDALGNEQLFMEAFSRAAPEILAYKQQHGGDLEGAFQKVTGTPWPAGRSVKLNDGVPEMTKDRTVKSVLGKYVAAPAALGATAAFAPGLLPAVGKGIAGAAMKGGVGALAGRMAVGAAPSIIQGDWKGALTGAASGAFSPGLGGISVGPGAGGSIMKDLLTKVGTGALQGGIQGGWKGAATGAAGGATSAIPGIAGTALGITRQSGVGGDIMASILNHGQDPQKPSSTFEPGQAARTQQEQVQNTGRTRPQGW